MRKHFLILMLLSLLPLAGWALEVPTFSTSPTLAGISTYDGEEHNLLSSSTWAVTNYVTASGGVLWYAQGSADPAPTLEGDGSDVEPKATNADTYTVWYWIKEDGNLYTNSGWKTLGTVTIEKAIPTVTISNTSSYTYLATVDNADFTVSTLSTGAQDVKYVFKKTSAISTTCSGEAGEWQFVVTVAEDANYKEKVETFDFSVAKADPTIDLTAGALSTGWTYDGSAHELVTTEPSADVPGTFYYIDANHASGDVKAAFDETNAATYNVSYKFVPTDADNYNEATGTWGTVEVKQAKYVFDQKPAAVGNITYNGSEHALLANGIYRKSGEPEGNVVYTVLKDGAAFGTFTAQGDVKATEVGAYTINWTYTPKDALDQQNWEVASGTTSVSIVRPVLNLGLTPKTVTYGTAISLDDIFAEVITSGDWAPTEDTSLKKLAALNAGLNVTVTKDGEPSSIPAIVASGANAGVYTIALAVKDPKEGNYNIKLWSTSTTITINQKALEDADFTLAATTAVYTGSDLKPAVTTSLTDADYTVAADAEMIDVNTYTFTFTGKGNYKGEITKTFEITQATTVISGLAISGWTYGESANVPSATTNFGTIEYTYAKKPSTTFGAAPATWTAGEWTVKATVAGTTNYSDAEATVDFVIAQSDAQVFTWANTEGFAFGETPVIPTATALEDATITYEYKKGTGAYGAAPATWTAGEWTVKASAAATDNYKAATDEQTFTVSVAENEVTVAIEGWTYGETANDPTVTAKFAAAGEPTIEYFKGTESLGATAPTAAGNYSVKASVAATSDYTAAEATANFTIAQAAQETTPAVAAKLTYNGYAQDLLKTLPTTNGGKVAYTVNGEAVAAGDVPQALNAGTYTVAWEFVADENHNAAVGGSVDVEILPAKIGYMLSNLEKTWDGETFPAEQVEKVFTLYAGELMGDDVYDVPFTLSMPEDYKDAGTYTFKQAKVTFKDGKPVNYKINFSGEAQIVINKKAIEAADYKAPTATDLTYNRTAQDLVEGAEVKTKYNELPIGKFVYATAEEGPYNETIPQGTDAVAYTVWYKVAGDKNHLDTEAASVANTIAQKVWNPAVTFATDDVKFDGADHMPADLTVADVVGEEKIALTETTEYTLAITKGEEVATELINVGTYTFTFTPAGNYTGDALVKTITITPAEFTVADFAAVDYTGQDQKPDVTVAGLTEGVDYEVVAAEKMINAGEYHIQYTGIGNYAGVDIEKIFKINKINAIAQASDATKVYNAVAGIEENPEITWGGLIKGEIAKDVITLEEGAITVKDPSANVGEYEIVINTEKFTSTNYNVLPGDKAAKFTITPAPLMVNWDTEATVGKVYGEADAAIEPKLDVTGAQGADEAAIIAGTVITRAAGEPAGKYAISLAADPDAEVFNNYTAEFTGADEAFVISKAPLTVSLAPQTVTYSGEVAVVDGNFTENDLVVSGLKFDDDKDVITTLPAIAVPDDAINVGEYQITLSGAAADNYELSYLPATLTIDPFDISGATVEIAEQFAEIGKPADEAIDGTLFTITGLAKDADAAGFKVVAAPSFIDGDGNIIEGTDYTKGLVLDAADYDIALNYTGWENNFFGTLFVLGGSMLVLDDNAPIVTEAGKFNVTFTNRKVNQDTWNVLVLPFDVTIAQISDAFGYAAVDRLKTEAADGGIHFQVVSSGTIPAGEPFIVKPTSDNGKTNFNQITFYNVDVKAIDASAPGFENPYIEDAAGNKFIGTFVTANFWGQKYWYMSGGDWKDARNFTSAKPVTLKPLRAYIEFDEANVKAPFIYIEEPNGEVTAIDAASFNNGVQDANGWYTVNGMKLDNAPVEKGVYIKNGKKVVIK